MTGTRLSSTGVIIGLTAGDTVRSGASTASKAAVAARLLGLGIPLIFYSTELGNGDCPVATCSLIGVGAVEGLRGPTSVFNESDDGNAAQDTDDLTGLSENEKEEKLKESGFTKESTTTGGNERWEHPDESTIWVKDSGDISRSGPSYPNPRDPHNSPNIRDRFGPNGEKTPYNPGAETHTTGERIKRN